MPSAPFKRTELPKTASRLKWAAKIKTGPDLSDILGFTQSATELTTAVASQLLVQQLVDVGSIESLEMTQSRALQERYAFGPNPHQPFQIVPLQVTVTLRLTKVMLKNLPLAEQLFSFAPSNLLNQQVPFIIYLNDVGAGDLGNTAVEHYLFGCWFADSVVKYDVTDRSDQRLIQNATVKATRLLTLDHSAAGNPLTLVAQNVFGSILAQGENQNLIDDLELT